jgi:hypothetical protein
VDAQKQNTFHERGSPNTNLMIATANVAPINCISTNIGTDSGAIPANVLLRLRATVTAGFANEVDEVKKYAPVIQAATVNGTKFARLARIVP